MGYRHHSNCIGVNALPTTGQTSRFSTFGFSELACFIFLKFSPDTSGIEQMTLKKIWAYPPEMWAPGPLMQIRLTPNKSTTVQDIGIKFIPGKCLYQS